MSEIKLRHCPFCGGEAKLKKGFPNQQNSKLKYAFVQCEKCHAKSATSMQYPFESYENTKMFAIQNWNNRSDNVVPRSAYDQVLWELDMAISQLTQLGLSLGEKSNEKIQYDVYGHWEPDPQRDGFHYCSICKSEAIMQDDEWGYPYEEILSDCCPWCGAKMKGKDDNNG